MGYMIFNDRNSKEFGIVIERVPLLTRPEREHAVIEMPNGVPVVYAGKGYKSYNLPVVLGLRDVSPDNIIAIHSWLNGYGKLIFSSAPDLYVNAAIYTQLSASTIPGGLGNMPIAFTVMPYIYDNTNKWEDVDLGAATGGDRSATITNAGNEDAQPTIKLYGSGELYLQLNSDWVLVRNVTDYCIVDVPTRRVYDKDGNVILNETVNDLMRLKLNRSGNSYLKVNAAVDKVEIKKNQRWT